MSPARHERFRERQVLPISDEANVRQQLGEGATAAAAAAAGGLENSARAAAQTLTPINPPGTRSCRPYLAAPGRAARAARRHQPTPAAPATPAPSRRGGGGAESAAATAAAPPAPTTETLARRTRPAAQRVGGATRAAGGERGRERLAAAPRAAAGGGSRRRRRPRPAQWPSHWTRAPTVVPRWPMRRPPSAADETSATAEELPNRDAAGVQNGSAATRPGGRSVPGPTGREARGIHRGGALVPGVDGVAGGVGRDLGVRPGGSTRG